MLRMPLYEILELGKEMTLESDIRVLSLWMGTRATELEVVSQAGGPDVCGWAFMCFEDSWERAVERKSACQ